MLISAAIAGITGALVAGSAGSVMAATPMHPSNSEIGLCKGANSCAGKSACGALKGKNGCQGEGYALLTKSECQNKKLSWKPRSRKHSARGA